MGGNMKTDGYATVGHESTHVEAGTQEPFTSIAVGARTNEIEIQTALLDESGREPHTFVAGETIVLRVRLRNCDFIDHVAKQRYLVVKKKRLLARGMPEKQADAAVGLEKWKRMKPKELAVGQAGLGWAPHVSVAIYRLGEAETDVVNGFEVTSAVGSEHLLAATAQANWRIATSTSLKPGKYWIASTFEIEESEANKLGLWRGKARSQDRLEIQAAEHLSPTVSSRHYQLRAKKAFDERKYGECVANAEKALQDATGLEVVGLYRLIGQACGYLDKPEKAITAYRRALEIAVRDYPKSPLPALIEPRIRALELRLSQGNQGNE